ncbi:uncharacterized protein LOC124409109 [Diprion similis]|uniref:uncharacterized protein LOC124409109 n=1 Tax=Diprion similis TaxID=362088 RepID=UPI001EF7D666|nr:uncharacterized protein LOC124409109 [Diprion similis]
MSSYKLTYFAIASLGEPIRFLLSYGGIDYEDNRLPKEDWPALKPKTPLGQLPILEVDGKTLYQSNAIVRSLAHKLNLFGDTTFEHFEVNAHIETIGDLKNILFNWTWHETPEDKLAKEAGIREKSAFLLGKFEAAVKENRGYFVGGKLSAADILFAGLNPVFSFILGNDFLADYPNLKNLVEKVNALPGIKEHIANRPKTLEDLRIQLGWNMARCRTTTVDSPKGWENTMTSYKLIYIAISGFAGPIRYLLSYVDIDFEDKRITQEAWPALKPLMPLEQVPVLKIDGKTLYQSNAIPHFLVKKFNLPCSNDFEVFKVDATLETIGDSRPNGRTRLGVSLPRLVDKDGRVEKYCDLRHELCSLFSYLKFGATLLGIMSSYKLTYFGIAGLAEPIRYLLSYGGIDFEDNRITQEAWPALKPQMPLEQVPVLEIDGKIFYQSNAIARFLAKKFNILGSNDLEAFDVDATLETIGDLRQLLAKWYWYSEPAQKAATEAETKKKAAFYLGKLDAWVKKNDGYFVAGKLSAADIVFAGFHLIFAFLVGKDYLADYPNLKGVVEKVEALPAIKAYIAKRPVTEY